MHTLLIQITYWNVLTALWIVEHDSWVVSIFWQYVWKPEKLWDWYVATLAHILSWVLYSICLIKLHLEYTAAIRAPHFKRDIALLENVKKFPLRMAFGAWGAKYQYLTALAAIATLEVRRTFLELSLLYRIMNGSEIMWDVFLSRLFALRVVYCFTCLSLLRIPYVAYYRTNPNISEKKLLFAGFKTNEGGGKWLMALDEQPTCNSAEECMFGANAHQWTYVHTSSSYHNTYYSGDTLHIVHMYSISRE